MADGTLGPIAPCMPRNQHGRQQPRAHSSCHVPGTNMAGSSPRPTAPAMSREPTWLAVDLSTQVPPCAGNQHSPAGARVHSSRSALGTNMADRKPQAHSFLHAPRNNMAARQPRDHSCCFGPGTNMADSRPRPTAPDMPREPKCLAVDLGAQVPPCPKNQHSRRGAQGSRLPP